ncbi:alpha/beta hydrolase fold domain-containing protein [Nocardia sp. NPDC020380]|uniref:alpha/beta hydrolase fold domain-containing protein n=1 Tax=Nocardia sp. NPDC020380 TaxID=3364309 RepID=UPI00378AC638
MVEPLPRTPEGVEFRHLRAFVAVAEELNFGRAAQRLYVTQPALSRQIRALEKLVGCELFHRNTRSVTLTAAGAALLEPVYGLLGELDTALTAARTAGGELGARMGSLWDPVTETFDGDWTTLRTAFESMHAQLPVPEGVALLPFNADGVPGLQLVPAESGGAVAIHLHGGGFAVGSALGYRGLAGAIADAGRMTVLTPEYRLAPEHPFPAARDDALTVYRWLLDSGRDPEKIALVGDSTGGMLLITVLVRARELGLPMPGAAVLLYPAIAFHAQDGVDPSVQEVHLRFQQAYLADRRWDDPEVSPMHADLTGLPPILIQSARGDEFATHTEDLAARLQAAGVPVRHEYFEVASHCFQVFWSFHPEAAEAVRRVGEFLRGPASAASPLPG